MLSSSLSFSVRGLVSTAAAPLHRFIGILSIHSLSHLLSRQFINKCMCSNVSFSTFQLYIAPQDGTDSSFLETLSRTCTLLSLSSLGWCVLGATWLTRLMSGPRDCPYDMHNWYVVSTQEIRLHLNHYSNSLPCSTFGFSPLSYLMHCINQPNLILIYRFILITIIYTYLLGQCG